MTSTKSAPDPTPLSLPLSSRRLGGLTEARSSGPGSAGSAGSARGFVSPPAMEFHSYKADRLKSESGGGQLAS